MDLISPRFLYVSLSKQDLLLVCRIAPSDKRAVQDRPRQRGCLEPASTSRLHKGALMVPQLRPQSSHDGVTNRTSSLVSRFGVCLSPTTLYFSNLSEHCSSFSIVIVVDLNQPQYPD